MERIKRASVVAGAIGAALVPGLAMAEGFTITPPTFDMATMSTYAGAILTALAAVWLVRKFIKVTNRS